MTVNIAASFRKNWNDKHVDKQEDFVASQVTETAFPTEIPSVGLQAPSTRRQLDLQRQQQRKFPKYAEAILLVSPSDVRRYPKRSKSIVRKNT